VTAGHPNDLLASVAAAASRLMSAEFARTRTSSIYDIAGPVRYSITGILVYLSAAVTCIRADCCIDYAYLTACLNAEPREAER